MKTDDLITLLARGAGPAPRHQVAGRLGLALGLGVAASTALSAGVLGLNPGLAGMGWSLVAKLGYVLGLLLAAAWLASRAARPGAPLHAAVTAAAGVVLLMLAVAAAMGAAEEAPLGPGWLLGQSWTVCPLGITLMSLPALAAATWAVRGLAPTRLRWAGFATGLLAGSAGALGYALHCSETSPMFVLAWYSAGMLVPAGIGALLGPRLLRW